MFQLPAPCRALAGETNETELLLTANVRELA